MFTNKTKLIGFVAIIALIGLICSSVIAFISIENAKKENAAAQVKIAELGGAINSLEDTLEKTNADVIEHENLINKYQEIFTAWSNATPEVKNAIDDITAAYGDAMKNAHLFPTELLDELEDEMMNAIYGAIRSTDPVSVTKDFEKFVSKTSESRYDLVLNGMLNKVKENGVTFPEDVEGVKNARAYFNGFLNDADIMNSFKEQELDKMLADIEALLDTDEENDLARVFEEAVAKITTPITLETSLEEANKAWNDLYSVLEAADMPAESTRNARALLDTYIQRKVQLACAKEAADFINKAVDEHQIAPTLSSKTFISSVENDILAWVKEFEVDEANMYLICDIAPIKAAYENEVSKLRDLYESFKKAVESIKEVNVHSKASIDLAFSAYDGIKDFEDVSEVLSLSSPNTVNELYATLENANGEYNRLYSLIKEIRVEIDRLLLVNTGVTQSDVDALNLMFDKLSALGVSEEAINTEDVDYLARLEEVRLLPAKNDALSKVQDKYDDYCDKANNCCDLLKALVEIKDAALKFIENAGSIDEVVALVQKAFNEFTACFN